MLDLDLVGAISSPPSVDRTLLKGHKVLPRRRLPKQSLDFRDSTSSLNAEDDMANGVDIPVTPSLPLTPPNQIQEDPQHDSPPQLNGQHSFSFNHNNNMAASAARSHQFSPPTPDVTPPRMKDTTPKARPAFPSLQSSMSSRADSFQTARENLSDDENMDNFYPSAHSLIPRQRQKSFPQPSPLATAFGHESDYIDGAADEEEVAKNLKRSVPAAKGTDTMQMSGSKKRTLTLASSPLPKFEADIVSERDPQDLPAMKEKPGHPTSPASKQELYSARASSQSPAIPDTDKLEAKPGSDLTDPERRLVDQVNTWRLSGGSFTSTIEAMVVETPTPKKRTLRHTEKRTSLRSVSSPHPQSTRTSTESYTDSPRRLVHKSLRISNQNRHSTASDMSIPVSTTSSTYSHVTEVIPVVVIPQRRSSLKSSTPSTRNQSITRSTTSSRRKHSVSRSKADDQYPPRRMRTLSDVATSTTGQSGRESRGRGIGRPPIPARSSSLSAPTSRNNSRATSLTSESLRRHTEAMQSAFVQPKNTETPDVLPSPMIVLPDGPNLHHTELSVPTLSHRNYDDFERLRAPSLHFTQSSVVSSSPGPIEIREATMVTYFPHNNDSLLVINSFMQPESQAVKALYGQNLTAAFNVWTPEQSTAALDVESPLRNPRTPPVPPPQKAVISTPTEDDNRQLANTNLSRQGSNRLSRGFGSMRRALSARRYSDNSRQQPMTRSLSVRSANNRRAVKARDSQLYSFWRPRGFWEDFDSSPGNERGFTNSDEQNGPPKDGEDVFVSNSLGLPQKRVIFGGPLVLARRISKSRQARRLRTQRQQYSQSELNLAMGIVRPHSPYQRRTVKVRLQRGVLFPIRTFRNVRQRVKDVRQMRARAALEARREKLKQSIGAKKLTDPYAVGPFNHGLPYEESNAAPGSSWRSY